MSFLLDAMSTVRRTQPLRVTGRVRSVRGLTVLVEDLALPVGALVQLGADGRRQDAKRSCVGEVVGFDKSMAIVMTLGQLDGVRAGDAVVGLQTSPTVGVGASMLGRCIDGLGRPIDDLGAVRETAPAIVNADPLGPMRRRRVLDPLYTGVRAIDLMTTLGRGQRLGIFAGPGVGKSTLLGMIARNASADVNVIALIGERGREVRDFIEESLGAEGLARSIVVVATSDESPLMRVRAAMVACAAAEHFRDAGADVMLMMDSVTRFAHAQRQIGLAVGEPPATRGYTPSVFSSLARLLERAGAPQPGEQGGSDGSRCGSITGLYTILVEGDDMTEPVADAARGILDGHIVLSRRLAQRGHFPAIDVLDSVSRVATDVCDEAHLEARRLAIRLLAAHHEVEELVQIGAYARGSNPESDVALAFEPRLTELLAQGLGEREPFGKARDRLIRIAGEAKAVLTQAAGRRPAQAAV